MKKFTFLIILSIISSLGFSQVYNNEWIDYSKTYYKFKVGATGLYRISAASLNTIGLANTPVQNFKLWRNGKEVALYTSTPGGPIGSGFIEFWGEQNDGVLDKQLYLQPEWQLTDRISLQTDTASYFLTTEVETAANNLRFTNTANNVAGNVLPAESHFIHSVQHFFKDRIHRGTAENFGTRVYSSSYDIGEMWSSLDITPTVGTQTGMPATITLANLSVAASGGAASLKVSVAGSAFNNRNFKVNLNGNVVIDSDLAGFEAFVATNQSVPLSVLASNNATVQISNHSGNAIDAIVAGFIDLSYPRNFNFNGQSNFSFTLPASNSGKYLEIANFNGGSAAPVLYDLTNNRRYVTEVSGGVVKVVLQPSGTEVKLVLVSQESTNATTVTSFTTRNFVNYTLSANQGDYLIISHPSLRRISNGADQVEQYRAYRSSVAGGSFNAKVYDIDQIVDQYAYGIKKHPLSIKNFLKSARSKFSAAPKFVLLLGKGTTYNDYRENQHSPRAEELNLIPTWGWPASDVLLASETLDPVMSTPIGRVSVINSTEIFDYLNKVKQYEQAQANNNQTIDNKAWMKDVVHVAGGNDPFLDVRLSQYFSRYENIIEDTFFGGNVLNFSKVSTGPVTPIVSAQMDQAFEKGISLITYFGHSSATSLDYNLNVPEDYNNTGKYPMFVVNGCSAGELYSFDTSRLAFLSNLSEIWVLAKDKGSIGFVASTHFGVENFLDEYTTGLYRSIGVTGYGKSITYNINEGTQYMLGRFGLTKGARLHAEQTTLHGDPAIKINSFPLPDYVVEEQQIRITPGIVSVSDEKFTVKAHIYNIGKAVGTDSVTVQIKRQYSNGAIETILSKKVRPIRYVDSFNIEIPIVATRDKGENKIIVSVDTDNRFPEISETNNSATKSFSIFADELIPVYPYNLSIINKSTVKLAASSADPLASSRAYLMEMDTTELFNSSSKINRNITSIGGLIEFDPGITLMDSTVYYWRVAPAPVTGLPRWNTASFVYLAGNNLGYNQSHFYQHEKSGMERIYLDPADRKWKYRNRETSLLFRHTIFPESNADNDFSISINGEIVTASACIGSSIIFNVFDPVSMKPYYNQAQPSTVRNGALGGFMKSGSVCFDTRKFNFEYSYLSDTSRRNMRDFLDWVPSGAFVTARLIYDIPQPGSLADEWKNDAQIYGAGNTLYDRLKNAGFADIDSFNRPRAFVFIFKKNDPSFASASRFTKGLNDHILLNLTLPSPDTLGIITSPVFGPSRSWKQVKWRGSSLENTAGDNAIVSVIGITSSGVEDTLFRLNTSQQDFDISSVSADQYPNLKLSMRNEDAATSTPYQLRYWRVFYTPIPEGALAPTITYTSKDTLEAGENLNFSIAFKNVSDVDFEDSIKVKVIVYDRNNAPTTILVNPKKDITPGESTTINFSIVTKDLLGLNTLFIDVNPDKDQPEQYHSNNFLYKNFFVKEDIYNPLMDVTFDGVHILNGDIVSAKPQILIKLKDESKFLALDDTSLVSVFVRYPETGQLRRFAFNTDTLRFVSADLSSGKNEAMIEFTPAFLQDSDNGFYELVVRAKDKSGNNAGTVEYMVRFQVYNKPMITNTFNYPNPFTTSTAFVFTITGSQVPQNIRIQILTITGKVVRDITKDELGPLHVGRNITEFKWDGTDQYGQKLANGIYLYRVLTNQNGNSLEKFSTIDSDGSKINTDQYFNKGYGKMYLMR